MNNYLFGIAVLSTCLHSENSFHYGLHAGAVKPMADLKRSVGNDRLGLGGGLWMSWKLSSGFSLRPHLAHQRFASENKTVPKGSTDYETTTKAWSNTSLGLDLCYHLERPRLCFITGAGLAAWKVHEFGSHVHSGGSGVKVIPIDNSGTNNGLFASMGVGWAWNRHFSTELKMNYGNYRKQQAFNCIQVQVLAGF